VVVAVHQSRQHLDGQSMIRKLGFVHRLIRETAREHVAQR